MIDEPVTRYFQAAILPSARRCGNHVAIDRAVDVVLDILLARPHHLHRPVDMLARCARRSPPCRARAGGRSRRRADDCAPSPSRPAGPPACAAVDCTRVMTCVPIQISQPPGVTCTVQFIGSMVACARNGSSYSPSNLSPCDRPLATSPTDFRDDAVLFAGGAQIVPDVGRIDLRVRTFVPGDDQSASRPFLAAHM